MPRVGPIKRKDLIPYLRRLGFENVSDSHRDH
jgi:hypothetical protein